ncbi:ribosomal protection-like ABC-F family protein [Murdochiella vaginalis]|uniref:ribosomal protection-like ABC-F family protein n=1 Tax=Murdochiella vaginalis TaxID=1852373 RepID=UPI0008FE2C29|nr:ABC-F family ATP-binding cassette domain-containing protein [Murdochiella vaginalis]
MAELTVQQLHKQFGVRSILEDVSFLVEKGEKIGIVGVNGSGKTTLMRLLVHDLEPDGGHIFHRDDLRIGYLRQNVHIESEDSLYEECKKGYARAFSLEARLRELEREMGHLADRPKELEAVMERHRLLTERFVDEGGLSYDSEIRGILKGMGFEEDRFSTPVNVLSGGEKSRLELATMLCGRPDILFLDEPTNHLDMEVTAYLEQMLGAFRGTVLLISHDRYFLNQVCQRILLVEHRKVYSYACGYQEFAKRREKDLEIQRNAYENQQEEIARQKEIIERLGHLGGSKRKRGIAQSRSRQKLLDKMVLVEKPPEDIAHMRLRLTPKYPSGEDVLRVEGLSKSFGVRRLFSDVSFSLFRGQRVGLIGENGVGKTTLFRLLLHQEEPDEGQIHFGASVKIAFFDQEQRTLSPEKTVLDELWDRYPHMDHYSVRAHLAKFQFIGDDIFRLVGDLSGGEKTRLALLKLMLSSANVLLLDEPTNHLDIESREILEQALLDYEGTVFVISHDRYFLNHVCTHIFRLQPQGMQTSTGNYDEYLRTIAQSTSPGGSVEKDVERSKTKTQEKKEKKQANVEKKQLRQMRARVSAVQREIDALHEEEARLQKKACEPALYEDYEEAQRVHDELSGIQQKREALEEEWLELETTLDEAKEGEER